MREINMLENDTALLCARPHSKTIDFTASRFVVARSTGVSVGMESGVLHLEEGDEVPPGALSADALRQLYEPPVHAIEIFEHAMTLPHLREAHARRCAEREGPQSSTPESSASSKARREDLEPLNRRQLQDLCRRMGLSSDGSKQELRDRLVTHLG